MRAASARLFVVAALGAALLLSGAAQAAEAKGAKAKADEIQVDPAQVEAVQAEMAKAAEELAEKIKSDPTSIGAIQAEMARVARAMAEKAMASPGMEDGELGVFRTVTYVPILDRDPFVLPSTEEKPEAALKRNLDLRSARLVGIVRGTSEFMALVEDERGESYTLLPGDRVANGKIIEVSDKHLKAKIRIDGIGQVVRLETVKEGD